MTHATDNANTPAGERTPDPASASTPTPHTQSTGELEAEYNRQDALIAKYGDIYIAARMQVMNARSDGHSGDIYPKDKYVIPILEAVDKQVHTEAYRLAHQAINVTLNEVIDAGLFPTPEAYEKMTGLLDLQRTRLQSLVKEGTE